MSHDLKYTFFGLFCTFFLYIIYSRLFCNENAAPSSSEISIKSFINMDTLQRYFIGTSADGEIATEVFAKNTI